MVYAVIDTNVIVSALITRSPQSPVLQVIQRILSGRVCTLVNNEILAEYKEVLARPKFNLEQETVETVISELLKHSLNVDCDYYGIALDHHRADSDSRACAQILLRYLKDGANEMDFIRTYRL